MTYPAPITINPRQLQTTRSKRPDIEIQAEQHFRFPVVRIVVGIHVETPVIGIVVPTINGFSPIAAKTPQLQNDNNCRC